MQNFCEISKTTEWSLLVSKANHSLSQQSKSMPQLLMPKKLKYVSNANHSRSQQSKSTPQPLMLKKMNSSMKTDKTF